MLRLIASMPRRSRLRNRSGVPRLPGIIKPWDWGSAGEGHPDVSDALRKAMSRNPYMGVFVASGYYDLATPFFATEYTSSATWGSIRFCRTTSRSRNTRRAT
ncbi:MAG: hypothetical protein R2688_00875 [Fimbriimonadaceae bacterium]